MSNSLSIPNVVTIFIHGVNSAGSWYQRLLDHGQTISEPQININQPLFLPFYWGEFSSQQPGGPLLYAVDEVHQMFENPLIGYNRLYQGYSCILLKECIDACNALGFKVNILAHSNGTLLALGALLLGAQIQNFILMGSPLDCDNARSQDELRQASAQIAGFTYNFWTPRDGMAALKGGIGAFGDHPVYIQRNPQVRNIAFLHGAFIKGYSVYSYHDTATKNSIAASQLNLLYHSDYFRQENVPILLEFLREFHSEKTAPIQLSRAQLDGLVSRADWKQAVEYQQKERIAEECELFKKYQVGITALRTAP